MSGTQIHLAPCDVWEYFEDNFESLCCEQEVIAQNDDVDIFICIGAEEDNHTLNVVVWVGDDIDDDITIDNELDAKTNIEDLYRMYFSPDDDVYDDEDSGEYVLTPKDVAIERDKEINDALEDFLRVIAPTETTKIMTEPGTKVFKDIKEHFLEYLYRKHKLNIFRPMLMDYGDGHPEYEEYPYESMEFDDETNPIYMS